MTTAIQRPFQFGHERLFDDVVFIIEADDFARHALWTMYHNHPQHAKVSNWEEVAIGSMVNVGWIDDRPINITINWAILNGKKVMFWAAVSQVVDHKMIEFWFRHFASKIQRCDASNFANVLHVTGFDNVDR